MNGSCSSIIDSSCWFSHRSTDEICWTSVAFTVFMSSTLPITFGKPNATWGIPSLLSSTWLNSWLCYGLAIAASGSSCFFSSWAALNCSYVPNKSIFRRLRCWGMGFELCFSRWIVLPLRSEQKNWTCSISEQFYDVLKQNWTTYMRWMEPCSERSTNRLRLQLPLWLWRCSQQNYVVRWHAW